MASYVYFTTVTWHVTTVNASYEYQSSHLKMAKNPYNSLIGHSQAGFSTIMQRREGTLAVYSKWYALVLGSGGSGAQSATTTQCHGHCQTPYVMPCAPFPPKKAI